MSLEELLSEDRKEFERVMREKIPARQYIGLTALLSKILVPYAHIQGKEDETAARINAFVEMAATSDLPPGASCRVLAVVDSFTTLSQERNSENYNILKEKCDALRANPSDALLKAQAGQELETAARRLQLADRELNMQFLALRGTVDEYNAWLDSLRGRTRPLSRDDYTIRDSILKRMKEQATPHVIGKLLEAIGK